MDSKYNDQNREGTNAIRPGSNAVLLMCRTKVTLARQGRDSGTTPVSNAVINVPLLIFHNWLHEVHTKKRANSFSTWPTETTCRILF